MSDQLKATALTIAAETIRPEEGEPPGRYMARLATNAARLVVLMEANLKQQEEKLMLQQQESLKQRESTTAY